MIDIQGIFIMAIFVFILGLISTYLFGFDAIGIAIKIIYTSIIIGFVLYMCYFDESELIEGMNKWINFFINVFIPFALGEFIGDALGSILRGNNRRYNF